MYVCVCWTFRLARIKIMARVLPPMQQIAERVQMHDGVFRVHPSRSSSALFNSRRAICAPLLISGAQRSCNCAGVACSLQLHLFMNSRALSISDSSTPYITYKVASTTPPVHSFRPHFPSCRRKEIISHEDRHSRIKSVIKL